MKLHLGCGKRYIPGYVHVDLAEFPHIDFKRDVRDLKIFNDNTVNVIYACHVLEYFDRFEVLDVLAEWRRVLVRNGILRMAVPDFQAIVEMYAVERNLDLLVGMLYGRMKVETPFGEKWIFHRTVYDFVSLSRTLSTAGFRNVRRYDWRETEHKNIDDFSQAYLPHMDKERGRLMSLNVEAEKA